MLEHAKQTVLAGFCVTLGLLRPFNGTVEYRHQLGTAAESIHGAALDQRLQHPFVEQPKVDLLAKLVDRTVPPQFLASCDD